MQENEQKQQLSIAYLHAVAAQAGYACQPVSVDEDSVDVTIAASGETHLLSPKLEVQLKATSRQNFLKEEHLAFPLIMKNYDDLRKESLVPRILVVLFLPQEDEQRIEQNEDRMPVR